MQTLLSGIVSYINQWKSELAVLIVFCVGVMIWKGHVWGAFELLAGMVVVFTAAQLAPQWGF